MREKLSVQVKHAGILIWFARKIMYSKEPRFSKIKMVLIECNILGKNPSDFCLLLFPITVPDSQKERSSLTDLVSLSSKTYVFEDKLTKYESV